MNDFTKEELLTLIDAFKWIRDEPSWRNQEGWDDKLQHKIQSMIDDYCEHEKVIQDSCLVDCCKCGWVGFK